MTAYYNENDPKAAAWLRELIRDGQIAEGEVDERSIHEVSADDVVGYDQCHFFAGLGGWSYALRLAGWPDDRPVWTGSCPCQPFSSAGKQKGQADERHLWPDFFRLIRECCPDTVFGEQVEAAVRHGWLDGVCADLEGEGYAVGSVVLGAHSVGAPHIRQRLFWVADAEHDGSSRSNGPASEQIGDRQNWGISHGSCDDVGRLADLFIEGLEGHAGDDGDGDQPGRIGTNATRSTPARGSSFGPATVWHHCRDGKSRRIPTEPALFPLADGIPGRVGLLRGAGNAIVPQVAAEFIRSYTETQHRA